MWAPVFWAIGFRTRGNNCNLFLWKEENEGGTEKVKASESKLEMKGFAEPLMERVKAASG